MEVKKHSMSMIKSLETTTLFKDEPKNNGTSGFGVGEAGELKAPEGLKAGLQRRV